MECNKYNCLKFNKYADHCDEILLITDRSPLVISTRRVSDISSVELLGAKHDLLSLIAAAAAAAALGLTVPPSRHRIAIRKW